MEETNLTQIIEALVNIEKNNLSDDPSIREWLKQITNEEFDLIKSLINVIVDNTLNNKLITDVLKVLR